MTTPMINPFTGKPLDATPSLDYVGKPTLCGLCGHSFKDDDYYWSGYTHIEPPVGAYCCKPCADSHLVVKERRDL